MGKSSIEEVESIFDKKEEENETTVESNGAMFGLLQSSEEVALKHTFNCSKKRARLK